MMTICRSSHSTLLTPSVLSDQRTVVSRLSGLTEPSLARQPWSASCSGSIPAKNTIGFGNEASLSGGAQGTASLEQHHFSSQAASHLTGLHLPATAELRGLSEIFENGYCSRDATAWPLMRTPDARQVSSRKSSAPICAITRYGYRRCRCSWLHTRHTWSDSDQAFWHQVMSIPQLHQLASQIKAMRRLRDQRQAMSKDQSFQFRALAPAGPARSLGHSNLLTSGRLPDKAARGSKSGKKPKQIPKAKLTAKQRK